MDGFRAPRQHVIHPAKQIGDAADEGRGIRRLSIRRHPHRPPVLFAEGMRTAQMQLAREVRVGSDRQPVVEGRVRGEDAGVRGEPRIRHAPGTVEKDGVQAIRIHPVRQSRPGLQRQPQPPDRTIGRDEDGRRLARERTGIHHIVDEGG